MGGGVNQAASEIAITWGVADTQTYERPTTQLAPYTQSWERAWLRELTRYVEGIEGANERLINPGDMQTQPDEDRQNIQHAHAVTPPGPEWTWRDLEEQDALDLQGRHIPFQMNLLLL